MYLIFLLDSHQANSLRRLVILWRHIGQFDTLEPHSRQVCNNGDITQNDVLKRTEQNKANISNCQILTYHVPTAKGQVLCIRQANWASLQLIGQLSLLITITQYADLDYKWKSSSTCCLLQSYFWPLHVLFWTFWLKQTSRNAAFTGQACKLIIIPGFPQQGLNHGLVDVLVGHGENKELEEVLEQFSSLSLSCVFCTMQQTKKINSVIWYNHLIASKTLKTRNLFNVNICQNMKCLVTLPYDTKFHCSFVLNRDLHESSKSKSCFFLRQSCIFRHNGGKINKLQQ